METTICKLRLFLLFRNLCHSFLQTHLLKIMVVWENGWMQMVSATITASVQESRKASSTSSTSFIGKVKHSL